MSNCNCPSLLGRVLSREVQPALGCTEPAAVALACSHAARVARQAAEPNQSVDNIAVWVSPGIMKNGFGVGVPNTNGLRGLPIAAALGAICGSPQDGLEVLKGVDTLALNHAQDLIATGRVRIDGGTNKPFFIQANVEVGGHLGVAIIEDSHTNLISLECDGRAISLQTSTPSAGVDSDFDAELRKLSIADLVLLAEAAEDSEIIYALKGAEMNLQASAAGKQYNLVGNGLVKLVEKGRLPDDLLSRIKITTALAVDARMAGTNLPVMSSGGSGNQGVVAILVPYLIGRDLGRDEVTIGRAILLSHLLNSYAKCFTGHISYMCGCAVNAGVGAAAAIAYLHHQPLQVICQATSNTIAEIAGLLCDGAKASCALKVVSAVDVAFRGAHLAMEGLSMGANDGILGDSAEASIQNLGRISQIGDSAVNGATIGIILGKATVV